MTELFVGLGISGCLPFVGVAPWYHPTLFLVLFDRVDVDPWPQLLFTPAAYLGALFLAFTVGFNLYVVQSIVGLAIGGATLLRHARRPRGDDAVWPSRAVGKGVLGTGVAFAVLGLAATVGVVEPP